MSGRTVVLVEDNPAFLSGVTELLRQNGFDVVPFSDFEPARRYLFQNSPDLLVTDIRLGAFNGLHLVVIAKQRSPDLRAFAYSAHADPVIEEEARRCGAGYTAKDDISSTLVPALLQELEGCKTGDSASAQPHPPVSSTQKGPLFRPGDCSSSADPTL
jgi:DNA-binding NtrC family response regulator